MKKKKNMKENFLISWFWIIFLSYLWISDSYLAVKRFFLLGKKWPADIFQVSKGSLTP